MSLLEDLKSLLIPFGDIKEATKNFTTLIGKGGYGLVYKGELLLSGKLTTVAVKRLQVGISGQGFKEFLTEIQLLTRYKHPNLISLIGYCNEGEEKLLIYEYAEHGSLDKYLSTAENRRTLTWKRRLDICVNAARGLNFLHNEAAANERVIHRDIKSANVLLDQNWKAMISDLGLSKLGRANEKDTYLITNASGTYGYCDPVYRKSGILTKESDVYSFGVVLFEVLCGRLCCIDVHNESRFLPELAQSCYKKGQINEIMDPELQNQLDSDFLKKFSEIAFKCIHNTRKQRPSMRWVLKKLEELKKTLDLQISEENNRKRKQLSSSGPAYNTSTMMNGADETGGLASSINGPNAENWAPIDVKPRIWKSTDITNPAECLSLRLPDSTDSAIRISRLAYINSGNDILALAANGVHKLWKWRRNVGNSTAKATAKVQPQLWEPESGILMTNNISDTNPEDAISCFALSNNGSYVISASGGKISLFNMMTFKTMTTFMLPPPAATFLAFHPQDNNLIAIGMENSYTLIYNIRVDEVKAKLLGHHKRVTGLAFSTVLNVLVSSGADSQLCVWNTNEWEKQTSKLLQIPAGRVCPPLADTQVQFHQDGTHLLAVHETQIAVYEAPELESPLQWFPPETNGLITHATYSCDSQSIFVVFEDGSVGILTGSTLGLRCRISTSAYLPTTDLRVHPLVVAAHPSEPEQFALGLSDGGVCVCEPLELEGDTLPPLENGAGPSSATTGAASTNDQSPEVTLNGS